MALIQIDGYKSSHLHRLVNVVRGWFLDQIEQAITVDYTILGYREMWE